MISPRRMRPKMQNYGLATADEGMLDWAWADERLKASRNYWLVTASTDGQPHAAPIWAIWMEGVLIFGVGRSSRKGRNLLANLRVVVHLESGDEVVIVEGSAAPAQDAALLARMTALYTAKYDYTPDTSGDPNTLYVQVTPDTVLAWREQDFPTSATRFEFGP
jgi:general stress protein 26